jgi:hypothetical protein
MKRPVGADPPTVLLREIAAQGHTGGPRQLCGFMRTLPPSAAANRWRVLERAMGEQLQVDRVPVLPDDRSAVLKRSLGATFASDTTLMAALLDRPLHQAHIVLIGDARRWHLKRAHGGGAETSRRTLAPRKKAAAACAGRLSSGPAV